MQAFLALLRYDLGQMGHSWLVRIWLLLLLAPAIFVVVVAASEDELASETMAAYVAAVLAPISWFLISIISASAVAGESPVIADSILSKSVTRTEYMAAKVVARLSVTLAIYLGVMGPFAYLINRYAVDDTSGIGVFNGLLMLAVLLIFLAALGISLSVILSNVQVAVVSVLLSVLLSGLVLQFLGLDWMSTTAVINDLPRTFRGETTAWEPLRVTTAFLALTGAAIGAAVWEFRRKDL